MDLRKSIALNLSTHGANFQTKAIQAKVERIIDELPEELAIELIEELRQISTIEELESSAIWDKVSVCYELVQSSKENSYRKEAIKKALLAGERNRDTITIENMVEAVIYDLPAELADHLIEELKEVTTISQFKNTPIWQRVVFYQEIMQNSILKRPDENSVAIALALSSYEVNSETKAFQAKVERAIKKMPKHSNQLLEELQNNSTIECFKSTPAWQKVLERIQVEEELRHGAITFEPPSH